MMVQVMSFSHLCPDDYLNPSIPSASCSFASCFLTVKSAAFEVDVDQHLCTEFCLFIKLFAG